MRKQGMAQTRRLAGNRRESYFMTSGNMKDRYNVEVEVLERRTFRLNDIIANSETHAEDVAAAIFDEESVRGEKTSQEIISKKFTASAKND